MLHSTDICLYVNVSDYHRHIFLIMEAKKNRARGREQKENPVLGLFSFSTFTSTRLPRKEVSHIQHTHTHTHNQTHPYLVKSRSLTSVTSAQVPTCRVSWLIHIPRDG